MSVTALSDAGNTTGGHGMAADRPRAIDAHPSDGHLTFDVWDPSAFTGLSGHWFGLATISCQRAGDVAPRAV
jgi:hypothetical protein